MPLPLVGHGSPSEHGFGFRVALNSPASAGVAMNSAPSTTPAHSVVLTYFILLALLFALVSGVRAQLQSYVPHPRGKRQRRRCQHSTSPVLARLDSHD